MAASKLVTFIATAVYYLATGTKAASLADIDHVVLFMQGKRLRIFYFLLPFPIFLWYFIQNPSAKTSVLAAGY